MSTIYKIWHPERPDSLDHINSMDCRIEYPIIKDDFIKAPTAWAIALIAAQPDPAVHVLWPKGSMKSQDLSWARLGPVISGRSGLAWAEYEWYDTAWPMSWFPQLQHCRSTTRYDLYSFTLGWENQDSVWFWQLLRRIDSQIANAINWHCFLPYIFICDKQFWCNNHTND